SVGSSGRSTSTSTNAARLRPESKSRLEPSGATGECLSQISFTDRCQGPGVRCQVSVEIPLVPTPDTRHLEPHTRPISINLPNLLTLVRIFIVPLLVVVLLTRFSEDWVGLPQHIAGVSLFLFAAITDVLDGWIARRRKQVSRFGILLDPIADKLLISAAFISL